MAVYRINITKEVSDEIEKAFYEKNAYKEYVDTITESSNTYAANLMTDRYVEKSAHLSKVMTKMEKEILGELYQSFVYNYSMDFENNAVVLTTEDPSKHNLLIGMGWEQ